MLKTINSLSGGKTSSYIAVNYPADIEVFALCCIDCHNAGVSIDKKLRQMANDKLQRYCSHMPEFVATSEDPKILKVMFDLEQLIGREIVWVRGIGWEEMIKQKKAIPNRAKRFCTSILKMQPIFEFLLKYHEFPVQMRIGYRYDEMERMQKANNLFKYAYMCEYQEKSCRWINRWKEVEWRIGEFPLIEDRITHHVIQEFWKGKHLDFPEDSNCLNCFWKAPAQLRKNFETAPSIMWWSSIQEDIQGNTFKDKISFQDISHLPIQLDFSFGTGSGCQAGFCTD